MNNRFLLKLIILVLFIVLSQNLMAYVGPGTGISVIGAFIAILVSIIIAIFGFVWYPIKRIIRKLKNKETEKDEL